MEEWKEIEGVNVSSLGNVDENVYVHKGYYATTKKGKDIHILVAKAFCNWFEGCDVHHINFDKLDNRAENLICLTHKEHTLLHIESGKTKLGRPIGSKNSKGHKSKTVLQFTKDGEFVAEYTSITEASRKTGINYGNIHSCLNKSLRKNGKIHCKAAGGFTWKYKEGQ